MKYKIYVLFSKVWEIEEDCSAGKGGKGLIKQVLDLEGKKLNRFVECVNGFVDGTLPP